MVQRGGFGNRWTVPRSEAETHGIRREPVPTILGVGETEEALIEAHYPHLGFIKIGFAQTVFQAWMKASVYVILRMPKVVERF